jgi:pectin methylesterase-like acyl-CoA thioesterase
MCRPLHVPRQFRTVQAAIDVAPDGATILVGAGVYTEPFRLEGKRLRIIGSDDGRTEIVSSSLDVRLATYVNGGGGELKNISFRGGPEP